jgi:baseplate J-like protein
VSESPAVLYLEADDEITSVVRRVRGADAERVVVVAPGRSRATSSAVALRLLARAGEEAGREIAVVGDVLTRSLAAEAGIAAYATLDDARRAEASAPEPVEPRHATIHVVRGSEETVARPVITADDATRSVPVARPAEAPSRRRPLIAIAAAVVGGLLLVGLAGAAVLPGATVTIHPLTEEVGPVPYVIDVAQPEVLSGTAEASATVTATGAFAIDEPATGVVVLFNWSSVDQTIAAGTLVASGDQAFETQADVVVPSGSLTPQGTIQAGEAAVDVTASAPGPAGNVAADAIDTVLSQGADARLRGFQNNNQRRVTNPEPTSGGLSESGSEITQADVDAAVEALTADLRAEVGDAVADGGGDDAIVVQAELAEPTITGLDDLVGARDRTEATIEGTLPWEAHVADRGEVTEAARQQLIADSSVVPAGHELLADSIQVAIEEANLVGAALRVDVTATARSAPRIDRDEVAERIAGLSADEAEAALEDLGSATVELWPGWVASVPTLGWRIEVRMDEP